VSFKRKKLNMGLPKKVLYGVLMGGLVYYQVSGRLNTDFETLQKSLEETRLSIEQVLRERREKKIPQKWNSSADQENSGIIPGVYWNHMLRNLFEKLINDKNPLESLKPPIELKDAQQMYTSIKSKWVGKNE
jgi:hypothetical protein